MNFSPSLEVANIIAFGVSAYFFFASREQKLLRRILVSSHSVLAATTLPILLMIRFVMPSLGTNYLVPLLLLLVGSSLASIVYSLVILRSPKAIHLLHLFTLVLLFFDLALGLIMMAEHV